MTIALYLAGVVAMMFAIIVSILTGYWSVTIAAAVAVLLIWAAASGDADYTE